MSRQVLLFTLACALWIGAIVFLITRAPADRPKVTFQCAQSAPNKVECAITCEDRDTCTDLATMLLVMQVQNDMRLRNRKREIEL